MPYNVADILASDNRSKVPIGSTLIKIATINIGQM